MTKETKDRLLGWMQSTFDSIQDRIKLELELPQMVKNRLKDAAGSFDEAMEAMSLVEAEGR